MLYDPGRFLGPMALGRAFPGFPWPLVSGCQFIGVSFSGEALTLGTIGGNFLPTTSDNTRSRQWSAPVIPVYAQRRC